MTAFFSLFARLKFEMPYIFSNIAKPLHQIWYNVQRIDAAF